MERGSEGMQRCGVWRGSKQSERGVAGGEREAGRRKGEVGAMRQRRETEGERWGVAAEEGGWHAPLANMMVSLSAAGSTSGCSERHPHCSKMCSTSLRYF